MNTFSILTAQIGMFVIYMIAGCDPDPHTGYEQRKS